MKYAVLILSVLIIGVGSSRARRGLWHEGDGFSANLGRCMRIFQGGRWQRSWRHVERG